MIKNVYWPSRKVPIFLVRFEWNLNFLDRFSKSTHIKFHGWEAGVFHADQQTYRHDEDKSQFLQFCKWAKQTFSVKPLFTSFLADRLWILHGGFENWSLHWLFYFVKSIVVQQCKINGKIQLLEHWSLTYLLIYSLHGADSFLRSYPIFSYITQTSISDKFCIVYNMNCQTWRVMF